MPVLYISVGVYPEVHSNANSIANSIDIGDGQSNSLPRYPLSGPAGFRSALRDIVIPKMEKFDPELLIISGIVGKKYYVKFR